MDTHAFESKHRVAYGSEQIVFSLIRQPSRVASRIAIHVEPDGQVRVDAPNSAPLDQVLAEVKKRSRWISQHVTAAKARLVHVLPREYVSGESIHYLGRRYHLKVIVDPAAATETRLRGAFVVVSVSTRDATIVRSALDTWYRERARVVFAQRLAVVAEPLAWVREIPPVRLQFMADHVKSALGGSAARGDRLRAAARAVSLEAPQP